MTRIIAGAAGGAVLEVPPKGTRPTSDRVRESLFGALDSAGLLADARVADLYAGSGALGLEAISRGAISADLVDFAASAGPILRRNVERVLKARGSEPRVSVHRADVTSFLRASARGPYDLVFVDPPYELGEAELTKALTSLTAHLSPDAVVIVERARRTPAPDWDAAGLAPLKDRAYGDTVMWWGVPAPTQPSDESQSR